MIEGQSNQVKAKNHQAKGSGHRATGQGHRTKMKGHKEKGQGHRAKGQGLIYKCNDEMVLVIEKNVFRSRCYETWYMILTSVIT